MSGTVRVALAERSYDIRIVGNVPNELAVFIHECRPKTRRAFFVTDSNVHPIARALEQVVRHAHIDTYMAIVPAGESSKSLEQMAKLYDELAAWPADRQTMVIAVGGGVIGDLAGFAAATYNRGLPLFMVPTTLLAMVDSSVGGKVGINHAQGKNLIGAFHQPVGVWIDTGVLERLPDREYRSGLAEVVKYGVILDPEFFAYIETNIDAILSRDGQAVRHLVTQSCRLKADVVEKDEREETGLRAMLNYGHTFAHAFETVGGYGSWLHGEAVSAGMVCASRLAELRGLVDAELTTRQMNLLHELGLPIHPKADWPIDEMIAAMYRDKKTQAGRLRFILPTRLGEVRLFDDVPEEQVRQVLTEMTTATPVV